MATIPFQVEDEIEDLTPAVNEYESTSEDENLAQVRKRTVWDVQEAVVLPDSSKGCF